MRRTMAILVLLILLVTAVSAGAQDGPALIVDAGQSLGPISPYVYGANYGPLSAVPLDLVDEAQASGITMLRFPGGRWGDQYNIQHYQLDTYLWLCQQMGAEPFVHVRLENGTPEAAAALVTYANIEKGYAIRYWGIGNEPNLFDNYTTVDHNQQWRAIAQAMRAVDPTILLIGPDTSQFTGDPAVDPRDAAGRDWVREFLLANGDLVDIVAVHRYPFPRGNTPATVADLRQNTAEWSQILPALRALIRETTGRDDLPVAITEANSSWSANVGGEASTDSLYNALWWADVLGRLIADQAAIVNFFELQTPANRGKFGLLTSLGVTPVYYTYQLYQRFGTELLIAASALPDVSIYAARRDDGALTVMIVNLRDEAVTAGLDLRNFVPGAPAEVWRLDAEHNAARLDDLPLGDAPLALPGRSLTLLIVPGG